MYSEPVFLEPAFQERIWGGTKLQKLYGYNIPSESTGEAWVISAHQKGPSIVMNGLLKGKSLLEVWKEHSYLFGNITESETFPLLTKILDANDDLSVQVHPDDLYAREVAEEKFGKTECWYILDCDENAEIIFGHYAQNEQEFKEMVTNGDWTGLLQRLRVKKGDFVYVPSGTLHAIGKGIVILETQQSSDITYRVYDYGRTDAAGNCRELHIEQALAVTSCPHKDTAKTDVKDINGDLESTQLIVDKYFTVYHWKLDGKTTTPLKKDFLLMSVIEGDGVIMIDGKGSLLKKGDNFILPATIEEYGIEGNLEIIVSHT
ncbi:mannose-6-phosphate isomerase, class I [Metaplanococcus flavidus]|uniref:Mannose-6-phosphate isomerase n=1 Tax=Metaplanococcus flavidus TaxID=569883 RepID=A0ABW3LD53_9BACL